MLQTNVLGDYLSKPDLASQLRVSARTLERWARLRTGPALTKVGVSVFYHEDDVRVWLSAQRREAKPDRTRPRRPTTRRKAGRR